MAVFNIKKISLKFVLLSVFASNLIFTLQPTSTAIAADTILFDRVEFLKKFKAGNEGQKVALNMALNNVVRADPATMYMAAAVAYKAKKLEDAAFLYYAAQMRAKFDIRRFHDSGDGGVSSLYGALSSQVGEEVNPAIARDPQALAAVVKRIDDWSVQPANTYDPGWDVRDREKININEEAVLSKAIKDDALKHLRPMSALLSDSEYFSAFIILQDFNLTPFRERKDPGKIAEKTIAEEKILKIEKERNLPYLTDIIQRQRK